MLLSLALVVTAVLGVVSVRSTSEYAALADTTGEILGAGHVALFAILSVGGFAMWREERRRRHAEEELRNSESRNRTVLETAVDAIVTIDEKGTVETFNQAAERIFGYARSEVVGRNVKILMTAPDREAHDGYLARYRVTGERKIIGIGREVVCRRKDGTEFPADLAVGEYHIEKQRKFTGFLRDISDRKRKEAQIREQAALLDNAQEAILVRDLNDRITYWNHGAERLYGWSAAEVSGRNCGELHFEEDSAAQLEPTKRAVLAGGEWAGELRKVTKEGRELVVESRWSLLRDDAQRPMAILVIEADVTEKKDRERQSLRAQRLESIGTLAGGIAHDLNNMLTPILMSAKLLRKERPATERDGLVANILASAERGADMVKQLVSFTGGVETQRARIDLRVIVHEIKSLLEHTLPKSISIRTELAEGLWPISGDATQLSQVLMNLCVNARDSMPTGGVLTIGAANRSPDEAFLATFPEARSVAHVLLTVTDTGSGIPVEVIDRVFDPFFTTKEHGKGTGLGLSTVLGIVRSHGGFVRVTSEPGQGSCFAIYLPAFDLAHVVPSHRETIVLTVGQGQLILIVDDEDFILVAAKATLEEAGYHVVVARDGAEAVATLVKHQGEVRVALVDMMMPGVDGPKTMRALREIDPQLRIIASSGLRVADDDVASVAICSRAFLQKPYSDDQLLMTLAKVLHEDL
jgi:PAS domain S-box-containing protein